MHTEKAKQKCYKFKKIKKILVVLLVGIPKLELWNEGKLKKYLTILLLLVIITIINIKIIKGKV